MRKSYKAWHKLRKSLGTKEMMEGVCRQYYKAVHHRNSPKPTKKSNYVGIEIECFSHLEENEVLLLMLECDLEKHMNIGEDGSVENDNDDPCYEFRILSTEKELPIVLKKVAKFLKKGKFKVNDSCGLHVHLDMRNRNVDDCYAKFIDFQDLLFGMVKPDRWDSDYCHYNPDLSTNRRMSAINYQAYYDHQTLEVRLHQGSVDVKKIHSWVNLLLKIIEGKYPFLEIKSKSEAVSWAGKDRKLKAYIKNNFKSSWFNRKYDVLDNQQYRREQGIA